MKTKRLLAAITCLMIIGRLDAQIVAAEPDQRTAKKEKFCELGISLYSLNLNVLSTDYFYDYPYKVNNSFFNGLYFKWFKDKNALRVSFNYNERLVSNYEKKLINKKGTIKAGDIKIGYQVLFGNKKLSAYFLIDLRYVYSHLEGTNYYDYHFGGGSIAPRDSYYSYLIERSQLGISKGFGLRWNLANRLVLNLETSYELYCYRQQDIRNSNTKQNGAGLDLNPVQLSIGFKF